MTSKENFTDRELKQKVLELSTLYEVSKVVSSTLDLDKIAASTLRLLSESLGLNRGALPLLMEHFLERFNRENGKHVGITPRRIGYRIKKYAIRMEYPAAGAKVGTPSEKIV